MEDKRRQRSRKPPRGSWQPTVPSWEKDFCRVVGTLDWETLLQMKNFMHLYGDVLNWDDSAAKEAFCNAKKRYLAEINGLSSDIPLPDPNLYIDEINWDSEVETDLLPDLQSILVTPDTEEGHDPVVIFGDSHVPNQAFLPSGWGDGEENIEAAVNHSSAYHPNPNQALPPTGWADDEENLEVPVNLSSAIHPMPNQALLPSGWGDDEKDFEIPVNRSLANHPMLNQALPPLGWGDDEENLEVQVNQSLANHTMPNQALPPSGWGDDEENLDVLVNQFSANPTMPNQALPPSGWVDDEENLEVRVSQSSAKHSVSNQALPPSGWGDDEENLEVRVSQSSAKHSVSNQALPPSGWGDDEGNLVVRVNQSSANVVDHPWEQNWGSSFYKVAAIPWPGCCDYTWQYSYGGSGPAGYMSWGGSWSNEWGWSYANNHFNYVGPDVNDKKSDGGQGQWKDSNFTMANSGGYMSNYRNPRVQGVDRCRNHTSRSDRRGQRKAPQWEKQGKCRRQKNCIKNA